LYQNYIFDFYGTLADIRTDEESPALWEKMSEIYRAMGADYDPEALKLAFRRLEKVEKARLGAGSRPAGGGREVSGGLQDEELLFTHSSPGFVKQKTHENVPQCRADNHDENAEPDLTKVFALLYQEKNVLCDSSQAKMTAVTFRALSREYIRVYDGVEELLGELRRRGKGVYLLSNAQADFTRPEIRMLGLAHYFDGIFLSSEQGCKKPSPVFFRRLLERYGLKASESIMIGNDEAADIAGARSVGMDTLYIHTAISPREYGRVRADYRIMDGDFRKVGRLTLRPKKIT